MLLGNGDGTFQAAVSYGNLDFTHTLAVADFNGDGNPDIVYTNSADGSEAGSSYPVGASPDWLVSSDFNGDDKPDLAVCGLNGVSLLPGNGDGTFQGQTTYTTATNPLLIVVADFNGDGKPDVAVAGTSSQTIALSILLGSGSAPVLNVSSTHTGNFTLGETTAAYSLTVSNGVARPPPELSQ